MLTVENKIPTGPVPVRINDLTQGDLVLATTGAVYLVLDGLRLAVMRAPLAPNATIPFELTPVAAIFALRTLGEYLTNNNAVRLYKVDATLSVEAYQ